MPRCVPLLIAVALVAGCAVPPVPTPPATASPTPSATPSPSAPPLAYYDDGWLSFTYPAGWRPFRPNLHMPWTGGPVLYLSNVELLPSCAVDPAASPNPPDAQGEACGDPIGKLPPGGVLVIWYRDRFGREQPTGGETITLDGRPTRLLVERPGPCHRIGADLTVSALIPDVGASGRLNESLSACLRGPGVDAAEERFRALLASVRVARP